MEKYRPVKVGLALCFFILCITRTGFTQADLSNGMSLTVFEDSVMCDSPCNDLQVRLTYRNVSDHDIVVFGLHAGPQPAFGPLEDLCELSKTGTGTRFSVSTNGHLLLPTLSISSTVFKTAEKSDSAFLATRSKLDSLLREMKYGFLKSGVVLKSQEEKTYVKTVPLRDFELAVGRYVLQFCYYSGEKTSRMPELKNIVEDKNYRLYQGCVMSRSIVFVVK